jgi:predicted phosphodiesterase
MVRIAILSDIHSAATAYSTALADAEAHGFDVLVLLGDLLTYGPFPERTIDITADAIAKHSTVLIEGNHDEIYLRNSGARRPHGNGWIAESIDWTLERIDRDRFGNFNWEREFATGEVLFAHANPYEFGNWAYLRSEEDFRSAANVLSSRGYRHGIFGHSHRPGRIEHEGAVATTVGSVGQPRSTSDKAPQWTMVTLERGEISIDAHRLEFDWKEHCESIRSTNMSTSTKERLCEFFS